MSLPVTRGARHGRNGRAQSGARRLMAAMGERGVGVGRCRMGVREGMAMAVRQSGTGGRPHDTVKHVTSKRGVERYF
jgi:hypothetical protein